MNNNPDDHLDFRPPTPPPPTTPPPPPPTQPHHHPNVVVSNPTLTPTPAAFASSSSTSLTIADSNAPQQQRKKRSRLTRPEDADDDNPANKRPKPAKKPDPSAPKITTPCTECGRTFWSWKALFGHMRCHPERHWRGIQPPPDFQRAGSSSSNPVHNPELELSMSEDDHDAASSLLILAGGTDQTQTQLLPGTSGCRENDTGGCRFECSSCKKVFGSHQALGGHRASHKNVKGCFAITKNDVDVDEEHHHHDGHDQHGNVVVAAGRSYGVEGSNVVESMEENSRMVTAVESGHQCSICWRVFSSGQALGGHKRCHWERGEEASSVVMTQFGMSSSTVNSGGLDLNLPPSASASVAPSLSASAAPAASASAAPAASAPAAPAAAAASAPSAPASEDDQCSSYSSPGLGLDLRLGL